MSTVEASRTRAERAEELRALRARLEEFQARREKAAAAFKTAKKERDALRTAMEQDADWHERFESSRRDFYAARKRLAKLSEQLQSRSASRARGSAA